MAFSLVCEFSRKGGRWCPLSYSFPSLWPSLAYQRMAPNASVSFRRNRGTNFAPLCTASLPGFVPFFFFLGSAPFSPLRCFVFFFHLLCFLEKK
jgi:hypothetical protein